MPDSSQNSFDKVTNADAHAQGIDGGLNLKTDPSRLAPPATTRADNGWYESPGNVQQLPAPSSVMPANTVHVYNLHARDLQAPATMGDLMVHGEVLDAPGSTTNRFTSPVWTDGNGATVNTAQPIPPWQQRTRVLSGANTIADAGASTFNPMMVTEEAPSSVSARRYGVVYFTGSAIVATFGLCDGSVELTPKVNYAATGQYCEVIAHQGASAWTAFVQNGTTVTRYTFDFNGAFLTSSVITTASLAFNAQAGVVANALSTFNHCGRSYCAYMVNTTATTYFMALYDCVAGTSLMTPSQTIPANHRGIACFSATTHQPTSSVAYLAFYYNFGVAVFYTQSAVAGGPITSIGFASSGIFPQNASNVGSSTSEGVVNYHVTGAACVFDGQGGLGAGASIGFTVYRTYPEQQTGDVPYGSCWYQNVSVDTFSFQANATNATSSGTISQVAQNVFRTASGVTLASKAWSAAPSEVGYAGPSAAKGAFCLVRAGAWEPYNGAPPYSSASRQAQCLYGQPTYFVLDHQARVVSRAFETTAPIDLIDNALAAIKPSGNPQSAARTSFWGNGQLPSGLGAPCITAPNNDLSALDITLPCWVQTDQKIPRTINFGGVAWFANAPTSALNQLCAINFTVSSQGTQVPALQAGPYSIFSGPMTCMHDGRGIVEANYHFQTHNVLPQMTQATGTATSGTVFPPGVYYYCAVVEWYDSLGRQHRSAPSVPVGVTVNAGSVGTSCALTCPIIASVKPLVGGAMNVRFYRSLVNVNNGVFYLVATSRCGAPARNAMTTASVVDAYYTDSSTVSASGPNITTQPRLYTNLASDAAQVYTFASTPPPAMVWQTSSRGRAFGLSQTFGQHRLYYTSVAQDRFPFEWNVFNYAPIPPEVGDVRSIESLDDKVLIFGTRQNAYLSGNGPASANTLGLPAPGDGYDTILPIPTPQGIVGTGGPCRGPDGIYFQGFSGLQLAGRDLSTSAVGAAVDQITGRQYNNPGQVFGRGAMLPSLQSIVWPCAQGPALVYNYLTQKWSTWPLLTNATCLVQRLDGSLYAALQPVLNGKYARLATASTTGADLVQLSSTYAPLYRGLDATPALVVETPWILPSGESGGESQLWDVTCTGDWLGPHVLQIETAYNYNDAYVGSTKFTFDKQPTLYQARVRPSTSRVWSVRYRVSVLPLSTLSSGYQMATLSDLVVNFGAKQGTTRLGSGLSG